MKKNIKYLLYITLSLLLVIILSVTYVLDRIEIGSALPPTPKPDNIPEKASWIGGLDGGMYVLVQKNNKDSPAIYDAEIYHSSGSASYKGKLVINAPENPQFNYNDVNSYSGWDGDTLYLQDGRYLTIVDE
ncbi:hypothetical protein MNBD_GAMMA19-114 [hydrothermal vent metagenome]|uniref:Uncharacterized protein n=1 Tax=hydrothermal vent metagenome TaxID=652676 RepID=A0A3B1APT5_9ZZZZ